MLVLMTRISVEQLEDLETTVELSVFTRVVYDGGQALPVRWLRQLLHAGLSRRGDGSHHAG